MTYLWNNPRTINANHVNVTKTSGVIPVTVVGSRQYCQDRACPTAHRSTFLEPLFWTGQLLDTRRLKARTIFDGSNFNADPHMLQVRWRSVYSDVWCCLVVRELFANWKVFITCIRIWSVAYLGFQKGGDTSTWWGAGEGAVPPPQKKIDFYVPKMIILGAFWRVFWSLIGATMSRPRLPRADLVWWGVCVKTECILCKMFYYK